jgi:hypothetical protein
VFDPKICKSLEIFVVFDPKICQSLEIFVEIQSKREGVKQHRRSYLKLFLVIFF